MIYSILIYLILIVPFSVRSYRKDGKKYLFIKIFNSLITLYVFVALAGSMRSLIPNSTENYLTLNDVPLWFNIIFSIAYAVIGIYATVSVVRLALRNEKAIKPFVRIILFLWILTGVEKYYVYITMYDEVPSTLYIFLSNLIYALIWGGIFLFYRSKKVRYFFANEDVVN